MKKIRGKEKTGMKERKEEKEETRRKEKDER